MENLIFEAGDIVLGLEPDEHVEIRRIAPFGNKKLVEGVTVDTRREIKRPLSEEELGRLTKVRGTSGLRTKCETSLASISDW